MEAIAGKLGSCELEARASFTGLPVLRANASTTVVTFMSLQVYVPYGTPALPPTTNSSVFTNLASQIDPIYLFKCDFSHYMPVRQTRMVMRVSLLPQYCSTFWLVVTAGECMGYGQAEQLRRKLQPR